MEQILANPLSYEETIENPQKPDQVPLCRNYTNPRGEPSPSCIKRNRGWVCCGVVFILVLVLALTAIPTSLKLTLNFVFPSVNPSNPTAPSLKPTAPPSLKPTTPSDGPSPSTGPECTSYYCESYSTECGGRYCEDCNTCKNCFKGDN